MQINSKYYYDEKVYLKISSFGLREHVLGRYSELLKAWKQKESAKIILN